MDLKFRLAKRRLAEKRLAGVQATVLVFFLLHHHICQVADLHLGFLSQVLSAKFCTFTKHLHT